MNNPALSRTAIILRGVVYAAAFVTLWVWLALSVRSLDPQIPLHLPAWLSPIGIVLAVAGALLTVLCIAFFLLSGRGTPAPFDPPRKLVAAGPYRYVRNPMYVGGIATLLGAGLALASPAILLLALAAFASVHCLVVFYEEPILEKMFGEDYERYKTSVGRWRIRMPGSPRRSDP